MIVRIALVLVLVIAASAMPAAAQKPLVEEFSRLPDVLDKGAIVYVTLDKGERTKGKITELSAATVEIMTRGSYERRVTFPGDQVVSVTKVDSRLNGFLIGAAIGAIPGIWLGTIFNQYCKNESPDYCPGAIAYGGALTGLAGGWIGFSIDNAINGQTLMFARPPRPSLQFAFRF
jgi:hypothetical protein